MKWVFWGGKFFTSKNKNRNMQKMGYFWNHPPDRKTPRTSIYVDQSGWFIAQNVAKTILLWKKVVTKLIGSRNSSLLYTLINTIVKIWISAQRDCRSTKNLSVVQFFMLFSMAVVLILRESAIWNNLDSKFLVKIWQIIFFAFFPQYHFEIYRL